MTTTSTDPDPFFVFGEAMIELSGVSKSGAKIGVAGDTYNTAVYLSRAGINARYVTALGDDPFSQRIISAMQKEHIDTASILEIPGGSPGLYAIEVDDAGERSFTYWRSASAVRGFFGQNGTDKIVADMKRAKTLYLSGITLSLFDAAGRQNISDIMQAVRAGGGQVVFDTNYRARGWISRDEAAQAIEAIMPLVSTALPTWEDEKDLFGVVDAESCAARWHRVGASEVVVKAGEQGAYSKETGWISPPRIITPIDTTGAGDSFNGAYLAARLHGSSLADAIAQGHALTAKVLLTNGAIIQ
ncbi:MAG: sugar kinase [Sphingorhabdus sp.]